MSLLTNEVYMLTVKITYHNGSTDIKDCLDLDEICLDGVSSLKVIRDERVKTSRAT